MNKQTHEKGAQKAKQCGEEGKEKWLCFTHLQITASSPQ